jgi:two-component system, chemotaxis family, chemotaxis protein CheY
MSKRILLVGHCGVDGPRLQSEIAQFLADVDVLRVNSDQDLCGACDEGADLLLINREPLGFEPKLGPDLIRELREKYAGPRCILVSDYEDAQAEAERAGALPGFGKSDIGSEKFERTVRDALRN